MCQCNIRMYVNVKVQENLDSCLSDLCENKTSQLWTNVTDHPFLYDLEILVVRLANGECLT